MARPFKIPRSKPLLDAHTPGLTIALRQCAGGGAVSVPLSSGAGGLGLGGSSATLGNQTNTTTNVNITIAGDDNDVHVDGYLNLGAEQTTDGQTSTIGSGGLQ